MRHWRRLVALGLLLLPVVAIAQVVITGSGGGSLTSGTSPVSGCGAGYVLFEGAAGGTLSCDSDLTFATDRLTATKLKVGGAASSTHPVILTGFSDKVLAVTGSATEVSIVAENGGGTLNIPLQIVGNPARVAGGTAYSAEVTFAGVSNANAVVTLNNFANTKSILRVQDNSGDVFVIDNDGDYKFYRTVTAAATTGAQTISKPAGSVNFAATATTLVVTNTLATTSSIIFVVPQAIDTTCTSFRITRAAGSFTITANAACTAETPVGFLVTN